MHCLLLRMFVGCWFFFSLVCQRLSALIVLCCISSLKLLLKKKEFVLCTWPGSCVVSLLGCAVNHFCLVMSVSNHLPPTSHLPRSAGTCANACLRHRVKLESLVNLVGPRRRRSDQWLKSRCEIAFPICVSSQQKSCFGRIVF